MANKNAWQNGVATQFKAGSQEAKQASIKGCIAREENQRSFRNLHEACKKMATPDNADALAEMLYNEALKGNMKAFELFRDTAGEKPVQRSQLEADVELQEMPDADRRLLEKVAARLYAAEKGVQQ